MVGLTKTKTELGSLQDTLAKTQLDLEKTNFELHAKTSTHLLLSLLFQQYWDMRCQLQRSCNVVHS